jgi:eukaryotic-like serine/threonine-protein kinase
MPSHSAENLLFAMLAMQMDFISREDFAAATEEWEANKDRPLDELLLERKLLGREEHGLLMGLMDQLLEAHDDDPLKSVDILATLNATTGHEAIPREDQKPYNDMMTQPHESGSDPFVLDSHGKMLSDVSGSEEYSKEHATSAPPNESNPMGDRFQIIRQHAKGGIGKVSVARDKQLARKVALKELKDDFADIPEYRERFVTEAEITGFLEHPGVAPVYALQHGEDGRPYYAMRFIDGKSLRDAVKELHATSPKTGKEGLSSLSLRNLLRAFVDVCNTIEFAHSRGVIHRDLKPDNVMLGPYGETLVVDWGLAKRLDGYEQIDPSASTLALSSMAPKSGSSSGTRSGTVVGTPAYMSPEQAEGDVEVIGKPSDIYSLGATLFSILTGEQPFGKSDLHETLESVRNGKFPRPRTIDSSVPKPLESICLKAMALSPSDRYSTPSAMARDIECWMDDESVSVHKERITEHAWRWMRRHKAWTQAGCVLILLAAISSVVIAGYARKNFKLSENNLVLTEEKAEIAVAYADVAQGMQTAIDIQLTGASEAMRNAPGLQEVRKGLLREAVEGYTLLTELQSDIPELELERGRSFLRLGDAHRALLEVDEAVSAYEQAAGIFDLLVGEEPFAGEASLESASARVKQGLVLDAELNRLEEADLLYEEAIEILETSLEDGEPEDGVLALEMLAAVLLNQAVLKAKTGDYPESETMLRRSVAHLQSLRDSDSGRVEHDADLCVARTTLADLLKLEGRYVEALSEFEAAISKYDALIQLRPENPDYCELRANTRIFEASVLRLLGRPDEEADAYRAAIEDFAELRDAFPNVPVYAEEVALTQADMGQLLFQLGETTEAEIVLLAASATFNDLALEYPLVVRYDERFASVQIVLGRVLVDLDRYEESLVACRSAVEGFSRLSAEFPDMPAYQHQQAVSLQRLAQALHWNGESEQALETYQFAIESLDELTQSEISTPEIENLDAFTKMYCGRLLYELGDLEAADEAFSNAEQTWEALSVDEPAPEHLNNLAWHYVNCPDTERRNPVRAIELTSAALNASPENPTYHNTQGTAHIRAGDYSKGVIVLETAMRLRNEPNGRDYIFSAMALWNKNRQAEAEEALEQGRLWMEEHRPGNRELRRIHDEAVRLLDVESEEVPEINEAPGADAALELPT